MVTGKEKLFDNIEEAASYVSQLEKNIVLQDPQSQKPPICYDKDLHLVSPNSLKYPLSAYYNNGPSDSFIMTHLASGRYSLKPNLCGKIFLYRGEAEFHSPCIPNMFRKKGQENFIVECVKAQEDILLMLSHPLVQLLDIGIEINGEIFKFEMNLYGLTQHYYNKTVLLDLTSNIEVANFFAVTSYNCDTDTYSPILDASHKEGVLYFYSLSKDKDFKKNNLSTIGLQVFPRSEKQSGFLLAMQQNEDFNEFPNLNAVRFKHNTKIAKRIFDKFDGGKKLFPDDILVQHYWGTNKNVISNRTLLLNNFFNPNKTIDSLKQELLSNGIHIQDYVPTFTAKELGTYYESVEDGFWEKFCDKVYIPGDDGTIKNGLKNARYDKRYRWAFEPTYSAKLDYDDGFLLKCCKRFLQ